eukprot:TRINITY_DN105720_c0_g1_i1.p1 TRINITY_DN105720_c0_g1~~TRINITY_DN105720_c0_g1_i1.p1  ORF type:complete len:333 (-),score=88.31 TRINITY_DN105720_c0_g1_i1:248-1246(-)
MAEADKAKATEAKLLEWDKGQTGKLDADDVNKAMAELREAKKKADWLRKFFIIVGSAVPITLLLAFAFTYAFQEFSDQWEGSIDDRLNAAKPHLGVKDVVISTQEHGIRSVKSMLSFDLMNEEWSVSDDALREMDTVSFELSNGTYYHLDIIEVERRDGARSGQESDKLEIFTRQGAKLRLWASMGTLEIKWPWSSMWEVLDVTGDGREGLDVDMTGEDTDHEPPERHAGMKPPERLLATARRGKGTSMAGGVGSGFSRGHTGATSTWGSRGVIIVPGAYYGSRTYSRTDSRNCYSDEEYIDGECRRSSASSLGCSVAVAATGVATVASLNM